MSGCYGCYMATNPTPHDHHEKSHDLSAAMLSKYDCDGCSVRACLLTRHPNHRHNGFGTKNDKVMKVMIVEHR